MSDRTATLMHTSSIDEFLAQQQVGVLSLADESGEAYGFPIAFVHYPNESRLYFRFAYGPDSQKRQFFETTRRASFVVHGETADGWKSVVAEGPLTEFLEPEVPSAVAQDVNNIDISFFEMFEHPDSDLEFRIVALDIEAVNGRTEAR